MALAKGAIRNVGWNLAGGYVSQILAFALFVVISRQVGPEAFGAVAIAMAVVELCRAVTTESVAPILIAQREFDEEAFNAGFAWTLTIAILVWFALLALSPLLARVLHTPALAAVLPQIGALIIFHGACRLQEARLVAELRFRALALRSVLAVVVGGALGVAAAYAGYGVQALIWQQWASAGVSALLLWGASAWRPRFAFSRAKFLQLARASLALAPAGLVTNLGMLADSVAVSMFGGAAAAGIYNFGKRVRVAMQLSLSGALDRVSLPSFARLHDAPEQMREGLRQALGVSTFVTFPAFLGLAAIAPELVDIFLGPAWKAAATPMALLLIGGAIAIGTSYCENVLLVLQKRRTLVALRVLLCATLLAGIAIVGRWGPSAVAGAALAAAIAHNIGAAIAVSRTLGFPLADYRRAVAAPVLVSLAMLALLCLARVSPQIGQLGAPARLAALIAVGALVYCAMVWLLARRAVMTAYLAARAAL